MASRRAKKKFIANFKNSISINTPEYLMRKCRKKGITISVVVKDVQNSSIKVGVSLIMSGCMKTSGLLSVNSEKDLSHKSEISRNITEDILLQS